MEPLKGNDPKQLGQWRIMGRLGEGGFGTVFLAERGAQKAAIKVVKDDLGTSSGELERFQLEITALQKLSDPYIAKIIDVDLDCEIPWFATEFINGPTLEDKVRYEGVVEGSKWFQLSANLFHALRTSHAEGVVHKDIKPSNIIIGESGNKLIDFGIAHVSGHTRKVTFGDFEGSRAFSSPESSTGNSVAGMDVFSAAVTLAFAGLGKSIWKGENEVQLMRSINESEPDLEGLNQLQISFLKPLLNKNVSDRPTADDAYQTSLKILESLDGDGTQINLGSWTRGAKPVKRRVLTKPILGIISLVLIGLGAATYGVLKTETIPPSAATSDAASTPIDGASLQGSSTIDDTSPTSKEIQANLELTKKYFEQGNYDKALIYARLAANAGNAHGMYDVAYILDKQGRQNDAIAWYKKSANLGYGDAFWNLGALYMRMKETDLAVNWYQKGAEVNNLGSLNALGFYYGDMSNNYYKAIPYYRKTADLGDVMGMANLGFAYDQVNDKSNALKWYKKASDLGDVDASVNLGFLYERESDWSNAKKYYQRAADKKDPTGMFDLAIVLGNHFGQGDKGCELLKEAISIKAIDPDIKKRAEAAIKKGCSTTPSQIAASPTKASAPSLPSDGDLQPLLAYKTSEFSEKLSADVKKSDIFGRAFLSGYNWIIPLTNFENESVPPINRVQFKDSSRPFGSWWNLPYELKNSAKLGWQAVVSDLGIQVGHSTGKKVCPEFRFALVIDGLVTYIWEKSVEPCSAS